MCTYNKFFLIALQIHLAYALYKSNLFQNMFFRICMENEGRINALEEKIKNINDEFINLQCDVDNLNGKIDSLSNTINDVSMMAHNY